MTHSLKYRLNYSFRLISEEPPLHSPRVEDGLLVMGVYVLLLVFGKNLQKSVFINQSPNGFYFYQPITRIKNILLNSFQSVKLYSAACFTVGLYHLLLGSTIMWMEVLRAAKQILRTTWMWINIFLFFFSLPSPQVFSREEIISNI